MRKYLFCDSYTSEGYQGLLEEGGLGRIPAAQQAH